MDEVLPLLSLAAGDDVQQIGMDAILSGCQFFFLESTDSKIAVALIAQGVELWIQAAGGKGKADMTSLLLTTAEAQGKGRFKSIGFQTRRRGLVKKALQAGYRIDGFVLRKNL